MTVETGKSDFDALLSEITDMAKALPAAGATKEADKKIDAAAKDGADKSDADMVDADNDKTDVVKSFTLKLEGGEEIEAIDGAALFKSLTDRVEKNEVSVFAATRGLIDMVKSLVEQVAVLSKAPAGRKTVLTVNEKVVGTDVTKSEPTGITADEFFAKALSMQAAGTLSGVDVRRAEAYANAGKPIPTEIVAKVYGATK